MSVTEKRAVPPSSSVSDTVPASKLLPALSVVAVKAALVAVKTSAEIVAAESAAAPARSRRNGDDHGW